MMKKALSCGLQSNKYDSSLY